jgi:hypothetical protein
VRLNQFVWIARNLIVELYMRKITKDKKKMAYDDLEEHVITWGFSKLIDIQDQIAEIESDTSISDARIEIMLRSYVNDVSDLVNLVSPLRDEKSCVMEWAFNFIKAFSE